MAKRLAKEAAGMGSEDGSSRVSGSHSVSDSDTYTQVAVCFAPPISEFHVTRFSSHRKD